MKARQYLGIALSVGLIVAGLLFAWVDILPAQDCRVIRIEGIAAHDVIRIDPETITISKGTCVIWFNRSTAHQVKVAFADGKKCASISDAPTGFSLDHQNCYVTSWIPFGGTSSLRFLEAGTYAYDIQATGEQVEAEGAKVTQGKIIVE